MQGSLKWHRGEGIIAGVCAGLAKALRTDPWVMRLLFLFAVLCFGTGLGIYLLLWFAFPKGDEFAEAYKKRFLGVCARVAQTTDIEVGIVRLGAILLVLGSCGPAIIGYFILYFVVPQSKTLPKDSE